MRRHELTQEQWDRIKHLMPAGPSDPGVTTTEEQDRLFVKAIYWMARTGSPWRDLPERYGNWNSVFKRFDRWAAKGIWDGIQQTLGADADFEWILIDSTTIRAHQHAAGKKGAKTANLSDAVEVDSAPKSTWRPTPYGRERVKTIFFSSQ